MASANDILVRARRRLGIHSAEEPYEAHEQKADYAALRDMLGTWALEGTFTSFTSANVASPVTLTFADETTLTDQATEALAANLAVRLADDYQVAVPAAVARDAITAKDALSKKQAIAQQQEQSSYDPALSYMPSQRVWPYGLLIDGD